MKPISIQTLQNLGGIYLNNIQDGFERYSFKTLTMSPSESYEYFHSLCQSNCYEHAYADFYYYTFPSDIQEKIHRALTLQEIDYLQSNFPTSSELIFPLNETLLQIICKLNASETLFSSIYFIDTPRTYWGNYNHEYVLFESQA